MTRAQISLDFGKKAVDIESETGKLKQTLKSLDDAFTRMSASSKKGYLDDLADFVPLTFILFNYRGLAALELLLTFKENLCRQNNWYPIDIIIDDSRFLCFHVGPLVFFYQNIPSEPESLVMLPARSSVLGSSSQWFTRNLLQHMQKQSFQNERDRISFKIQKMSISRPDKKFLVNLHLD
ncbi:MAG: hypothetical protein ACTSRU_06770 [Candidatus Hodarchaeales archaeon]